MHAVIAATFSGKEQAFENLLLESSYVHNANSFCLYERHSTMLAIQRKNDYNKGKRAIISGVQR